MPIETGKPGEGIQPILRKLLLNQQAIVDAISGGAGGNAVNLTAVGGTSVASPLPVAVDPSVAVPIAFSDSASIDAFDRLRVSNPTGLFESTLTYDAQPLLWNQKITGAGSVTHLPDESAVRMRLTGASATIERTTRSYFRYQPGKSQLIFMTFAFGQGSQDIIKRVGYFDTNNGIYLQEVGGELSLFIRSSVTGSPVNTGVSQGNWNINTFPDFDPTKASILVIDLEWLGVGRVRVGFVQDGRIAYAHEFLHANTIDTVYMSTAQLPLCLFTTSGPGFVGTNDLIGICGSVISEGGQDENIGFPFSIRSTALRTIGTPLPVLSIRPKATYNGRINRVEIVQRALEVFNQANALIAYDVIYNGTLTGAVWTSVDSSSVVEYDLTATAISGGIKVLGGFVGSTNQAKGGQATNITGRLPLSLDIDGANPTPLSIVCTNLSGIGDCAAQFNWQEYR